jgi:hypothetical protein
MSDCPTKIEIGDLFFDDTGLLLMVISYEQQAAPYELYWVCDEVCGGSIFWYKTEEVAAGKEKLKKVLDKQEEVK